MRDLLQISGSYSIGIVGFSDLKLNIQSIGDGIQNEYIDATIESMTRIEVCEWWIHVRQYLDWVWRIRVRYIH